MKALSRCCRRQQGRGIHGVFSVVLHATCTCVEAFGGPQTCRSCFNMQSLHVSELTRPWRCLQSFRYERLTYSGALSIIVAIASVSQLVSCCCADSPDNLAWAPQLAQSHMDPHKSTWALKGLTLTTECLISQTVSIAKLSLYHACHVHQCNSANHALDSLINAVCKDGRATMTDKVSSEGTG